MKKNGSILSFRGVLACALMCIVFVASTTAVIALPEGKSTAGELIVLGSGTSENSPFALLNGERAFSGRTFFSASTIATTAENAATLKLGKLGSVVLSPNSILNINFGNNKISGTLIAGQIKVSSNEGVDVKIQAANKIISNDAGQIGVLTIDAQKGATPAAAEIGFLKTGDVDTVIPAQTTTQTTPPAADENSYVAPLIVFSGIVAVAVIYAITNNDDDTTSVVSPTR